MARYDRIAPLSAPAREQAFPAWPVFRDLEGQDRDPDVCRRARLRFLALRPVCRLIDREPGAVSASSFSRQIEAVREELAALPARDVERTRITRFLRRIEERDPERILAGLLEFAEQAYEAGHVFAAQEYAHTAAALAPNAADVLLRRMALGEATPDETDLERCWSELRSAEDVDTRTRVLERLGVALMRLRVNTAAERCFAIIEQRAANLSVRSRARAARALLAALGSDALTFRQRRERLLHDSPEWAPDPRVATSVHIDLAHGCLLAGDLDFARDHLRSAIAIARRQNYEALLGRAESILSALEQNTEVLLQSQQPASEAAQRIAAEVELLDLPVPAT